LPGDPWLKESNFYFHFPTENSCLQPWLLESDWRNWNMRYQDSWLGSTRETTRFGPTRSAGVHAFPHSAIMSKPNSLCHVFECDWTGLDWTGLDSPGLFWWVYTHMELLFGFVYETCRIYEVFSVLCGWPERYSVFVLS
jgi:hypothetical protein